MPRNGQFQVVDDGHDNEICWFSPSSILKTYFKTSPILPILLQWFYLILSDAAYFISLFLPFTAISHEYSLNFKKPCYNIYARRSTTKSRTVANSKLWFSFNFLWFIFIFIDRLLMIKRVLSEYILSSNYKWLLKLRLKLAFQYNLSSK